MKILLGFVLFTLAILHLLIGITQLAASQYQEIAARDRAGDLSGVSGDLELTPDQQKDLDAQHQKIMQGQTMQQTKANNRRLMASSLILLALAILELAAGFITLINRMPRLILGIIASSMIGMLIAFGLSAFIALGYVSLTLGGVALILAWFRQTAITQTSRPQ